MKNIFIKTCLLSLLFACTTPPKSIDNNELKSEKIKPVVITEKSYSDTDDPCIWINHKDPENSLILGTDKDKTNGGIYVYDLNGKIIKEKTITGLKRPNNIDLVYQFNFGNEIIDIAVFTERLNNKIRVLRVPEMEFIDNGGIEVFEDSDLKEPMGIALYHNPKNNQVYAIVSRKTGPSGTYLYQYLLQTTNGAVTGKLARKFGAFSGKKEIEAIAVDNELGFVYFSDEHAGIRKYNANPEDGNDELALFGAGDFKDDAEGISIFKGENGKGYILVSNQQKNTFVIYPREGSLDNPHHHTKIKEVPLSTNNSDGSDLSPFTFNGRFKGGIFVAMSDDKTFHFYNLEDILNY